MLDVQQGSPEWRMARLGAVTASRIGDVMAKGRDGRPSLTRARYLAELVCERLTGVPTDNFQSADMAAGSEREADAREAYAFHIGVPVETCGFLQHATIDGTGASPDALVGADGLAEFKCPAPHTHLATLKGAPIDRGYLLQMQWEMACAGRRWCDFVSFHPSFPIQHQLHVRRVPRDDGMIAEITGAVKAALAEIAADVERLGAEPMGEAT